MNRWTLLRLGVLVVILNFSLYLIFHSIVIVVGPDEMPPHRRQQNAPVQIPIIHPGSLKQFGYKARLSAIARHTALKKALQLYGKDSVIHKLTAVRTFSKNKPDLRAIFDSDIRYVEHIPANRIGH